MSKEAITSQLHNELLKKALKIVQSPLHGQDPSSFATFSSLLKQTKFFRTRLEPPANLHDFVHLAKVRLSYEVHPYGTILMKENDYADKLYIILQGNVLKLQQKPYSEIEKEAMVKKLSTHTIDQEGFETLMAMNKSKETSIKISLTPKRVCGKPLHSNSSLIFQTEVVEDIKGKIHETLTNIENLESRTPKARRVGLKVTSIPSINNVEMDHEESFPSLEDFCQESETKVNKLELPKKVNENSHQSNQNKNILSPSPRLGILKTPKTKQVSFSKIDKNEKTEEGLNEEEYEREESDDEEKKKRKEKEKIAAEEERQKNEGKFVKFLAKKNPKLKPRLFLCDIMKVHGVKTFQPGEYFGENFYKKQPPRENSILAVFSEELHVLTLSRESYNIIMEKIISQTQEKSLFFTKLFPSFDKATIEKFSYHFSQERYRKDEVIYRQSDPAKRLYVVMEGDVRLSREVKGISQKRNQAAFSGHKGLSNMKHNENIELPVTSITKNQFFGEEILLKKETRQYNAVAKFETIVYFIEADVLHRIKEGFKALLVNLKEQTKEKFDWREKRVLDLLEQHVKHVINPLHEIFNSSLSPTDKSSHNVPPLEFSPSSKINVYPTDFGAESQEEVVNPLFSSRSLSSKQPLKLSIISKNRNTYKARFSRKIESYDIDLIKATQEKSPEGSVEKNINKSHDFSEFNIRKELEVATPRKHKLPMLSLNKQLTGSKSPQASKSSSKNKKITDFSTFLNDQNDNLLKSFVIPPSSLELYNSLTLTPRGSDMKPKIRRLLQASNQVISEYGFQTPKAPMEKSKSIPKMVNYNDMRMEHCFKSSKKGYVKGLKVKLNEICREKSKKEKDSWEHLLLSKAERA